MRPDQRRDLPIRGAPDGPDAGQSQPEECLVGPGADLLCSYPQLAGYARAFIESAASAAAFFWPDPGAGWLRVELYATEHGPGMPGAQVAISRVKLPHRLTTRELDVLTLLAGGLSNVQIAERLVSSPRTISTHVEHILAKLGQTSRTGAVAMAVERGYLRLPVPGDGPLDGLTIGLLQALVTGQPVTSVPGPAPAAARQAVSRPLLVGSAFPLHGPASDDGRQMLNGSALAIGEINARGGIGGRRLEQIVVSVDIFSPDDVRRAFGDLFSAGVDALTSGYVFPEDLARDLAADYGAPYVHAMTSQSQAMTVRDNRSRYLNFFQVCPTEVHYGPGFIRFLSEAQDDGWRPRSRRVAFVESALPSGQMVNALTVLRAERSGWEIAGVQTVPALGTDWDAVVRDLERIEPAAVMITQFLPGELAEFQILAASRLPETVIYAIYNPSVPEFLHLAGGAAEGLVWATVTGTYHDVIGQRFRDDYAARFGSPPGWSHAGIAYDEVNLLAQAWMLVPNPHNFDVVCHELRRVRYRGVNGAYFLDNAEQAGMSYPDTTPDPSLGQAHLVLQVQNGEHKIISPQPYAESSFRAPGAAAVLRLDPGLVPVA
ncbi:MAG: ABC transporter substrate-binding protein [Streptosporangiaceae bacterium]